MTQHVPEDLLAAFVDGDTTEQLAVHIAQHLDDCPSCGARAASLEPLAAAFAAVEDPSVPNDLVARILAVADAPRPSPVLELSLGGLILAMAAAMMAVFGSPVAPGADPALLMHALNGLGRGVIIGMGSPSAALSATLLFGAAGAGIAWRLARVSLPAPAGSNL